MRKGRQFYDRNYEKVLELHSQGLPLKDIAARLGMSYSAVYHWVKGLRKPETGNISSFVKFLEKGPSSEYDIEKVFPKHNEIFLTASKRGLPVKRCRLERKYGKYATWYFLPGQENALEEKIKSLENKYKEVREKLLEVVE